MALVAQTSYGLFNGSTNNTSEVNLDSGTSCDMSWQMINDESSFLESLMCSVRDGDIGSSNVNTELNCDTISADAVAIPKTLEPHSSQLVIDENHECNDISPLSETDDLPLDIVTTEQCQGVKQKAPLCRKGNHSKAKSKRRRDKKKLRQRKKGNHKWKEVDPLDIGFHISLLPRLEDVTSISEAEPAVSENAQRSFDETLEENKEPSDISVTGAMETPKVENYEHEHTSNTCDFDDDEAYFSALGIDVSYSGPYDDSITDWDGIRCVQPKTFSHVNNRASRHTSSHSHVLDFPPLKNMNKSDIFRLFELECSSTLKIHVRKDRDQRVQKAHNSIKSKHCKSVLNNAGKKKLYMHHRLYKKLDTQLELSTPRSIRRSNPMPKGYENVKDGKLSGNSKQRQPKPAPAQNLKYALHATNAPGEMNSQLSSFLVSAQHRDLTPEDYDMLLRLDDTVKPKTVSDNVLKRLKTEKVPSSGLEDMCAVCLEPYVAGQERKFLNCGHYFHTSCIDTWLTNSSMNCPLDGLPVSGS